MQRVNGLIQIPPQIYLFVNIHTEQPAKEIAEKHCCLWTYWRYISFWQLLT